MNRLEKELSEAIDRLREWAQFSDPEDPTWAPIDAVLPDIRLVVEAFDRLRRYREVS